MRYVARGGTLRTPTQTPPPPPPPVIDEDGDYVPDSVDCAPYDSAIGICRPLQVKLTWDTGEMDLYATDPLGHGLSEHDPCRIRQTWCPAGVLRGETYIIRWAGDERSETTTWLFPESGAYEVSLYVSDQAVNWTLQLIYDGQVIETVTGTGYPDNDIILNFN